jgi:hypothetical protein
MLEIENPSVHPTQGYSSPASPLTRNVMADDFITDLEIAVLCDLLEGPGANLKAHKRSVLDQLIANGLVEPAP